MKEIQDVRLDPYRDLKDKPLARDNRFIAEGKRVTRRLLDAGLGVESILADDKRAAEMAAEVNGRTPIYVIPPQMMRDLVGFKVETGVLSIGFRPRPLSIDRLMRETKLPVTLLVAPIVKEPANLGALMRTAAAFGVSGLVLGPRCCDPFSRRAVRVSMGTVFRLPIVHSEKMCRDLIALRDAWRVELCAAVLDEGAEPLHTARRSREHRRGMALLLGHEVEGLDTRWAQMCDRKLIIPMHLGTDSLNVSVATAVFCYHFLSPRCPVRLPEAWQ